MTSPRRSFLLAAVGVLAALGLGAKAHAPRADACPFVAMAMLDSAGRVTSVEGGAQLPAPGRLLVAFDTEGKVGTLQVHREGEVTFSGKVPTRISATSFDRALLLDHAYGKLHLAQPVATDLPDGVFPGAVQLVLADAKGAKVVLVSMPGATDDENCDVIQCKLKSGWKMCWTNCAHP